MLFKFLSCALSRSLSIPCYAYGLKPQCFQYSHIWRARIYTEQPAGTNAINYARSLNEQNIAQLKKNNLKAYMVHYGQTLGPKVYMTKSKQRMFAPDAPDPYLKERKCGGKHTRKQTGVPIYSSTVDGKLKCPSPVLVKDEELVGTVASKKFLGVVNTNETKTSTFGNTPKSDILLDRNAMKGKSNSMTSTQDIKRPREVEIHIHAPTK